MNETIISYPQYCYTCFFPFLSAERNTACPNCKGVNAINCFNERMNCLGAGQNCNAIKGEKDDK
jgi:hypothetical protein